MPYAETMEERKTAAHPLSEDDLRRMHAYWRAANYLTVGQIYLKDNPLLERPLTADDIKPRLLGHWGTTAGLNFIYTHLNRLIVKNDLNMMYVIGCPPRPLRADSIHTKNRRGCKSIGLAGRRRRG